jgi:hypothetical protein
MSLADMQRAFRRSPLDKLPAVGHLARWTRIPWSLWAEVPGLATIRLPVLHKGLGEFSEK